jgi:ubiquinone/menaquinone biosynthesis C-methylase UbiE
MSLPHRNTIAENRRIWDEDYDWSEDGEEWSGQARYAGVDYFVWKRSLVEALVEPYARDADVLEIGCGHGRWSAEILAVCRTLTLSDLGESCIAFCRRRFAEARNVRFEVSDGVTLPSDLDESIDFVWSFDAFVHMERSVIAAYMREIERVLRPGGHAVVHHGNRRHATLPFVWLERFGDLGRLAYRGISMGLDERHDGWRANVSAQQVAEAAQAAGLVVERQINEWNDGFGVPRFRDRITVVRKPVAADQPQS